MVTIAYPAALSPPPQFVDFLDRRKFSERGGRKGISVKISATGKSIGNR